MKSLLKHQEKKNKSTDLNKTLNLPLQKSEYLIKHISKLVADHDVTESGTMIKVTYKKPDKTPNVSSNLVNGIYYSADSIPIYKNLNNMNRLNISIRQDKSSDTDTVKSGNGFNSLTNTKQKTPIYLNNSNDHTLFHSTPEKSLQMERKNIDKTINGMSLLKKFEDLKKISGITQNIKNSVTIKPKNSNSPINVTSKPVSIKANTSDKFPGPSPSIKIPKGITIIRLKGNPNSKKDRILKTISSEKIILPKDKRQQNSDLKRKITIKDSVIPTKIVKKSESNLYPQKNIKELKNYNDITDFCETIIGEDLCENSLCNSNGCGKKEILFDDPELPQGWKRVVHTRYEGTPFAKRIVYIYSPQGKKFQFKWKLRKYLERTKSSLCAEQFHFGLYKRTKPIIVPPKNKIEKDNFLSPENKISNVKSQVPSTLSRNIIVSRAKAFNLKHSNSVSRNLSKSRLSHYKIKAGFKNKQAQSQTAITQLNSAATKDTSDKRQLLLYDPDLPFGWKRIINSNNSNGKLQVNIISPEGRIFRRRYRLHEYLTKHQYSHSLDRFYFGLYPKKDSATPDQDEKNKHDRKANGNTGVSTNQTPPEFCDDAEDSDQDNIEDLILSENDMSKFAQYSTPMYEDPNLPEGWKRFIKIRACGKSAGRMEVVLVSPDGKRLRSKGQLQNYIRKNELNYNANDFDFSVFGHIKKRVEVNESRQQMNIIKQTTRSPIYTHRPVPDLDINALQETKVTPEGEIINKVAGIMISCGLSSGRSERRLRVPKKEHENNLKTYLKESEDLKFDGDLVPPSWIQTLVKCRSDFRSLESDAAATLAIKTKEFIKELSLRAFHESNSAKNAGLQYEDIVNIVDKYESLSPLKIFIPQKITYKEYVKLNRPKQFLSFT